MDNKQPNNLPIDKIQKLITEFEQIGLFSHLKKNTIARIKKEIPKQQVINEIQLLGYFPEVTYFLDLEDDRETAYTKKTNELSKISHGAFHPKSIREEIVGTDEKGYTLTYL
ncbi:TPA: hypothetical protein HA241_05505 [Candidatus Woesearchaeota archaeon]|nr:hypothetical protein [Candidatus Woesearchaeota archaeon]